MSGFRHDLGQFYSMKAVMEQLFGRETFARLKESGGPAEWKTESLRLLKAFDVAIENSVAVADDEWRNEAKTILDLGRAHMASASTAADIFCALASTFTRMSFHQLGMIPTRATMSSVTLAARFWRLDAYRSVQYVQTDEQRQTLNRRKRPSKA